MGSIWTRLGIAVAVILLMSSYQNCGQSPSQTPAEQTSETEEDQIVRAMNSAEQDKVRAITSLKVNAGEECRAENLRCIRKIYSPQAQDLSGVETLCTSSGVCLSVQTHTYDSRAALAACVDCGPDAAAPGGEYNREEVTCWLGEPGHPDAKVNALRATFEDAVQSTLAACSGDQ